MSGQASERGSLAWGLVVALLAAVGSASCGSSGAGASGAGADGGSGGLDGSAQGAGGSAGGLNGLGGDGGSPGGPPVTSNYPCPGCAVFPGSSAPVCAPSVLAAPTIAYPASGALFPPNMNVLEVQFVPPAGATLFEVDFANAITNVRVETACQSVPDVRGGTSRGCGVTLPQGAWNDIASANRDADPVGITVRATDATGACVSTSTTGVQIGFAKDDLAGGIYYWQSATYGGVGGKTGGIYYHDFGTFDPTPTPFYTSGSAGTCVGCHTLSRDGVRMSLLFDDPDGDDEFSDVHALILDVASRNVLGGKVMSPGFQTWTHDHSKLVASTFETGMGGMMPGPMMGPGGPMMGPGGPGGADAAGATSSTSDGAFAVIDGTAATLLGSLQLPTGIQATEPDLSKDDGTLLFVVPAAGTISSAGDHHFKLGALWSAGVDLSTLALGAPAQILGATGHNYYYPEMSPDRTWVVLNDAPDAADTATSNGDAFYNRNARVKILHYPPATGAMPLDLKALNVADGLTNSWPRWSPFPTTFHGHSILWVTFSSNRDYGLHLVNGGFDNCYPPESPSYDQPQPLSKQGVTYQDCAQPQIWMAAVVIDVDPALDSQDRSFPAFWLPFQDVTAHNHSAQWVEQVQSTPPASTDGGGSTDAGTCGQIGVACATGAPPCCADSVCCLGACSATCSIP